MILSPIPLIVVYPDLKDPACVDEPDLFFPDTNGRPMAGGNAAVNRAKAICRRCPEVEACLDFAVEQQIWEGVWGSTTGQERAAIRAEREAAA